MTAPKNRLSVHPSKVLWEEFLKPLGLNHVDLARQMNEAVGSSWPRFGQNVYRMLEGLAPVTAEMAVALSVLFDTSPEFWMNMQVKYDLTRAHFILGIATCT